MESAEAELSRPFGVDVGKAERAVWLVKVPAFVSSQWQALPLLQEREAARAHAEPALVPVLAAALRCVPLLVVITAGGVTYPPRLGSVLHTTGELSAGWDNARKADDFHRLLTCVRQANRFTSAALSLAPSHSCARLQRPGGAWQHRRRDAVLAGARVEQVCLPAVLRSVACVQSHSLGLSA